MAQTPWSGAEARGFEPRKGAKPNRIAATFSFAGKNDIPRVIGLPGADDKGSEVRFPIASREGVRKALEAVKHIVGGS